MWFPPRQIPLPVCPRSSPKHFWASLRKYQTPQGVTSPPGAAIQLLASPSNSTNLCSSLFQRGVSVLLGRAFKIPLPPLSLPDSLRPPLSFSPNSIRSLEKVDLGGGAGVQLTELHSPARHGGYDTDKIPKIQRRNRGSNQGRLPEEGDV